MIIHLLCFLKKWNVFGVGTGRDLSVLDAEWKN
jgi:hypothetical protein